MSPEDYARIGSAYDTDPLEPLTTIPRAPRPRFVSSFGMVTLGFIAGLLVALAVWAAR
jgi:hypothetical protein